MEIRHALSGCAALIVVAIAFGCGGGGGGGSDHPRTYAQSTAYCEATCKRQTECDPKLRPASCKSKCEYASREYVASLRPDYATAVTTCESQATCDDLESDDKTSYVIRAKAKCWSGQKPEMTELGKKSCISFEARANFCGVPVHGDCQELMGGLTDAILHDLQVCFDPDRPCKNFAGCVNRVSGLP